MVNVYRWFAELSSMIREGIYAGIGWASGGGGIACRKKIVSSPYLGLKKNSKQHH